MSGYLGFDIGVAVFAGHDEDDFPVLQVDAYGEQQSGLAAFEQHSPFGLLSMPMDPDMDSEGNPGLGCQMLYATEGGKTHGWLSHDPRVIPKLPKLKKGESLLYAAIGQFIRLDQDGAITLFTTDDKTTNGQSVYFQIAPDALRFIAPWGAIIFDNTGFHLKTVSGARLDLGGIGGIGVGPVKFDSYAKLQGMMVDIQGTAVALGGAGPASPLADGPMLVSVLTQMLAAIIAASAGPAGATATATAVTAIGSSLPTILAKVNAG